MKKVYQSHLFFSFFTKTLIAAIFLLLSGSVGFSATYTWNASGTASYIVSTNWTPSRITPANTDILVFNSGTTVTVTNVPTETIAQLQVTGAGTIVNLQAGAVNNTLTVAGSSLVGMTVVTGTELNINGTNALIILIAGSANSIVTGNMTFTNAAHKIDGNGDGVLAFNSPAIFTQGAGCTGYAFNSGLGYGTLNFAHFNSGSIYVHQDGLNPFGSGSVAGAKVKFNPGSSYKLQQNIQAKTFFGRTFSNVELDIAGVQTLTDGAGDGAMILDNLTITQGSLSIGAATFGVNIKGNISVAAGQTLAFNSNVLSLNGTLSSQTIVNNGTLTFGAAEPVVINNTNGITVNSDITFNNTVTFTNGVVTVNSANVLTLSASASVVNVGNGRYVDGKVKKIGSGDFEFPVGKTIGLVKSYVPIKISSLTSTLATDSYTAEYKRGSSYSLGGIDPSLSGAIKYISRLDYWTLDRSVATPAATANVTLNWTAESSNGGSPAFILNPNEIVVMHFNAGPNVWDNFGNAGLGTGTATVGNATWSAWANPASSVTTNAFTLGSITFANPLPITVNYINGTKQNGTHLLNWQVSCLNNVSAKMIVERSADNKNFTAVNTVTATALRCQQPFDYTDAAPLQGINYYRLKTINDDGKVSYSTTIVLLNKQSGFDMVSLLPNVVTANAVLNIAAAQKTKLNIVITDIAGRQVQQANYNLVAGSNQFEINVASLAAGTYQITGYTAEGLTKTLRFVKQ